MEWLIDASAWVLPVVIAITMHEAAHGWMAERFGDNTARLLGRITLNPLRHIDRFGTIILPAILLISNAPFVFGYAKPVPVDFTALKPPRTGMVFVALAGPGINLILALISCLLLHIDTWIAPEQAPWVFENLYRSIMMNVMLAVFNLLPILPLDGGRVISALLPGTARQWFDRTERAGMLLMIVGLMILPMMGVNLVQILISEPAYFVLRNLLALTGNGQSA